MVFEYTFYVFIVLYVNDLFVNDDVAVDDVPCTACKVLKCTVLKVYSNQACRSQPSYLVDLVDLVRVLGLFWGNLSKLTAYFDEIAQKIRPPAAGGQTIEETEKT